MRRNSRTLLDKSLYRERKLNLYFGHQATLTTLMVVKVGGAWKDTNLGSGCTAQNRE